MATLEEHQRALRARSALGIGAANLERTKRRQRKLPKQVWPIHLERKYRGVLLTLVDSARDAAEPLFEELPRILAVRIDAGEGDNIRELIDRVRVRVGALVSVERIEALAMRLGEEISDWSREQLLRQLRAEIGVNPFLREPDLRARMEAFSSANIALVKDLPEKLIGQIEMATTQAVVKGTRHETLAKQLEERFGVAKSRARLIARDQVGTMYGQISAARQKSLGVTEFTWETSNDRRVRDEHKVRQGKVYKFSEPPAGELPGTPILCRCYPAPVLAGLLGDVALAA